MPITAAAHLPLSESPPAVRACVRACVRVGVGRSQPSCIYAVIGGGGGGGGYILRGAARAVTPAPVVIIIGQPQR
jgi:hypothetical protein